MKRFLQFILEGKEEKGTPGHMAELINRFWGHKGAHDAMKAKPYSSKTLGAVGALSDRLQKVNHEFLKNYSHLVDPKDRKKFSLEKYGHPDRHGGSHSLATKIMQQKYGRKVDD